MATWNVVSSVDDTTFGVAGELDISNTGRFAADLRTWTDDHADDGVRLVLDLRGVTFLDSSALHELIDLHARRGSITVRPSAVVQRLLDLATPGLFTTPT